MRHRILLVEDAEDAVLVVQDALAQHHQVLVAKTVDEAADILAGNEISLVLLDLTLPQKDGYTLLAKLQGDPRTAGLPVICLTGRAEVSDKVAAFSLGAEDYLVKPVNTIELRARVDAKLRRVEKAKENNDHLVVGRLEIDRTAHIVYVKDAQGERKAVSLTPTEFKLLCHLARQPERVFTREQLMVGGWGNEGEVFDRAVDVHISGIRRKLGDLGNYLQAVPGVGYKLSLSNEKATRTV